jgi:hypothetical protein
MTKKITPKAAKKLIEYVQHKHTCPHWLPFAGDPPSNQLDIHSG